MPLLISCAELAAGMLLAEPFCPGGRRIIAAGRPLGESHVRALREKYPAFQFRVADPLLDARFTFQDDSRERDVALQIQQSVAQCMMRAHESFAGIGSLHAAGEEASRLMIDIVQQLRDNPVSAIMPDVAASGVSTLARHAGRVVYFSLMLASAARDYILEERARQSQASRLSLKVANDLLPLGIGAMLCDVGLFEQFGVTSREMGHHRVERSVLHSHPARGAELLPAMLPAGVKAIVRTHHERCDGSGYPKGLTSANLHIFSRVVGLCDAFAAAIDAEGASPANVLREMSMTAEGPFDPTLMGHFLKLVQPFAIGSKHVLQDGRGAVVVRFNAEDSLRPIVAIAFDADGNRLSGPEVSELTPWAIGAPELPEETNAADAKRVASDFAAWMIREAV